MTAQNRAGKSDVSIPSDTLVAREPVTGRGPALVEPLRDIYSDTRESAKLQCRVTGEPTPQLTWYIKLTNL